MKNLLLSYTTSLKRRHLTKQSITFAQIALLVCWLDILFRVSTVSAQRNHVIKMQDMVREDSLLTDIAVHPITLKNVLIVDSANGGITFPGISPSTQFASFMSISLPPYLINMPSLFVVTCSILVSPLLYLFTMGNIICSLGLLYLFTVSCLVFLKILPMMLMMGDAITAVHNIYLFVVSASIVTLILFFLFPVGSVVISRSLTCLLTMGSFIFLSRLSHLFTMSGIIISFILLLTISAISPIRNKRFLDKALRTNFGRKQGELLGVVYFAHSKGDSLLSARGCFQHRSGTTLLPLHYTIDALLKQYGEVCICL
jgi:hypothetical protein